MENQVPGAQVTKSPASAVQEVPPELAKKFTEAASLLRGLKDNPSIHALRTEADDMVKKGFLIKVGGEVKEGGEVDAVTYYISENPQGPSNLVYPVLEIHSFMNSEIYTTISYNERGQETERVKRSRNGRDQYPQTKEAERSSITYHSNGQIARSEVHIHKSISCG